MLTSCLEDIDFADDAALLSHRHRDMQVKTIIMASTAEQIGFKTMNSSMKAAITIDRKEMEDVEHFTYLGSKLAGTVTSAPPPPRSGSSKTMS